MAAAFQTEAFQGESFDIDAVAGAADPLGLFTTPVVNVVDIEIEPAVQLESLYIE